MIARGQALPKIPGIGEDLARKIEEIATTGKSSFLERLHHELPAAITELLHLPGLRPKKVKALYEQLRVESLEDLRAAAKALVRHLAAAQGVGRVAKEEGCWWPSTPTPIRCTSSTTSSGGSARRGGGGLAPTMSSTAARWRRCGRCRRPPWARLHNAASMRSHSVLSTLMRA